MNEHEPRPEAREVGSSNTPDWRRLEVARGRFIDRVAEGIAQAMAEHTEIDHDTARMIAHVLGRAYSPASHLAEFGRTGEGSYLDMRDEYLDLYGDERADAITKEWINWLGTYLVQRENLGSGHQFMNEHLPPRLEQLLVTTNIVVGSEAFTVHVPASYGQHAIEDLTTTLHDLRLDEDEALQAFLALSDVNALGGDIMGDFDQSFVTTVDTIEDAVASVIELDEREREIDRFAAEQGFIIDQLTPDYEALAEQAREAYDLIEWKGRIHVFNK